ncbi:hypothetical protein [Sphingomonas hengshuiensis]|uniref:Uncharacterized protein n=1 Tax=Sphingomonas hengshuiensis TaxID=1609977 RepID=A0A7U4LEV5_9SPHN|nr:hypothetical protein [Sphingomonas hengshuiensis]AJP71474.1 hypothetical protein TS85_06355 [Sphingomonas hengshuiensis]
MATNDNTGEGTSPASDANKSFLETAQEAVGSAVDATVEAVKEHPIAAAAIAAGAAAAVGGAAYAASQLLGDKDTPAKGPAKK